MVKQKKRRRSSTKLQQSSRGAPAPVSADGAPRLEPTSQLSGPSRIAQQVPSPVENKDAALASKMVSPSSQGARWPSHSAGYQSGSYSYHGYYGLSLRTEDSQHSRNKASGAVLALFLVVMTLLIIGTVVVALLLSRRSAAPSRQPRFVSPTKMSVFRNWIAISGARQCNNVTRKIFGKGGSIGDAAVATILCVCVAMPHRCGLGGGFVATYYNRSSRNASAIVVRPRAPGAAQINMYRGIDNASLVGPRAVATFGELMGYELLLNVTGSRVPWKDLFDDAIKLADDGVTIYEQLAESIAAVADHPDSKIRKPLSNPNTTRVLKLGDKYHNKKLAETLRKIAGSEKKGRFFESSYEVQAMVSELREMGGILTVKDFEDFRAELGSPASVLLSQDEWLFTTSAPTSGAVLAFVVSVLDKFRHEGLLHDDELSAHRLVEALKFGFARRFQLGDPESFEIKEAVQKVVRELLSVSESDEVALKLITGSTHEDASYYGLELSSVDDHGSGHVCIVSADGDALCLVSTINTEFGAQMLSKVTGIWYNNEMNDFSTPHEKNVYGLAASSNNYIRAGMRPVSSLCPVVVVDARGDVLFAASATGGQLIISALAQVLVRSLWMEHTVKEAIDAGRLHNQLFPRDVVQHEKTADLDVLYGLKQRGHSVAPFSWLGTVVAIRRESSGVYTACGDYRNLAIASADGGWPV